MLWTPQKGAVKAMSLAGFVGSAAPGKALPSHAATTLLDGAIIDLFTAGANIQESWGICINITATGLAATASEAKLDILLGASTEDVLIADLICGYAPASTAGHTYFFPVHIPGGVRISARLNSVRTGISAQVVTWLYAGGAPPFRIGRKVTTYGSSINAARGQAVTPTASGGTGSVTEMTAASSEDHFAFLPGFQVATDTTITPAGFINVGIGIGASVEHRIGTWLYTKDTNESMNGPIPCLPAFVDVPSGTRLTMITSNSGANDAAHDGHIYAVS